jgi:transcriptional regulator with XRE-family HTH domain
MRGRLSRETTMSHDDPTDSDPEPVSVHARRMSPAVRTAKLARAKARRAAFRAVLDRHGLRPAEVAQRAGLPTANAIYNFYHGRSDSLTQVTLEKVAAALSVTTEELMGLPAPRLHIGASDGEGGPHAPPPLLTCEAGAGVWQRSPLLPPSAWQSVQVPLGLLPPMRSAFAVRLRGGGSEGLYPHGTIAICVPVNEVDLPNPSTWRALVRCERHGRHELTLQELAIRGERCWLTPRSEDPALQAISVLRWPPQEPALVGDSRSESFITIEGIVVATWRPEEAFAPS